MALRVTQSYVAVLHPTGPLFAENQFSFTQDLATPTTYIAAPNSFSFANVGVPGQDVEEFVTQFLNFTPRTVENATNSVFATGGTLPKGVFVNRVISDSAENVFAFSQEAVRAFVGENSFSFVVAASHSIPEDANNSFSLVNAIDTGATDFENTISQDVVKQHVSFWITDAEGCKQKEFSPFVGGSDDNSFPAVDTTSPTLTPTDLVLAHPYGAPTTTLNFKNPDFDNTEALTFQMLNVETRGGDRILFADNDWIQTEVLDFIVSNLNDTQADAFVSFVNTSLGDEISLTDWEGTQWRGVLIGPESNIERLVGGFRVQIRFQGSRV